MKALTIYGIPNCDTMKKAFVALDESGTDYTFHNYKKEGITESKLRQWIDVIGTEQLVNKKRNYVAKPIPTEQVALTSTDQLIAWLQANPSAIKRPLVESGKKIWVGLDELKSNLS